MATWVVLAWRELGQLEAPDLERATLLADRAYPGRVARVQSLASYRIQQEEDRIPPRRRREGDE